MKKMLSMLLAFALAVGGTTVFAKTDYIASDWAKTELSEAEEAGIIPEEFAKRDLKESINREEFASVLVLTYETLMKEEITPTEENPFTDTDDENAIKAYTAGFIQGTGNASFMPEAKLSREQAATMLTRIYKSAVIPGWTYDTDKETVLEYEKGDDFADNDEISDWAQNEVYFMAGKGIVNGVGDNKFAPKNNISTEQALITALRFKKLIEKETEYDPDPYKDIQNTDIPDEEEGENDYTVAFIGGSLTEGGTAWITATKNYLQEKMPDKKVKTLNAGKGGTNSSYGAARFSEDVGQYAPDLVFIEFAVNDAGMATELEHKVYMESMLHQCKELQKEPAVIFLYAPKPVEKDSETYIQWEKGVRIKEGLAEHYGIKSINVYDYMQRDYEATKKEKGYATFTDYLKKMYARSGDGFNVHGGYQKYGEAIIEAFDESFDEYLSPMKDVGVYCTAGKKTVEAEYNQITVSNQRMNYSGKWARYNASNKYANDDELAKINDGQYVYPFFKDGIAQILNANGAFGFDTKAEAVSVSYITSTSGAAADVYIDGEKADNITCKSTYHGVNYNTKWISLPNDGKTHRVIFKVKATDSDGYVFRFGSVIERFMKR